jgi:hypothetical protein
VPDHPNEQSEEEKRRVQRDAILITIVLGGFFGTPLLIFVAIYTWLYFSRVEVPVQYIGPACFVSEFVRGKNPYVTTDFGNCDDIRAKIQKYGHQGDGTKKYIDFGEAGLFSTEIDYRGQKFVKRFYTIGESTTKAQLSNKIYIKSPRPWNDVEVIDDWKFSVKPIVYFFGTFWPSLIVLLFSIMGAFAKDIWVNLKEFMKSGDE